MPKLLEVNLQYAKETPGTYVYHWVGTGAKPPVTSIYIKKDAFKEGKPTAIKITVEG